jgi:hypothetical protein
MVIKNTKAVLAFKIQQGSRQRKFLLNSKTYSKNSEMHE